MQKPPGATNTERLHIDFLLQDALKDIIILNK